MNFTKKVIVISTVLMMGLSMGAFAQAKKNAAKPPKTVTTEFNYHYIEAGFADYDLDTALQIRASYKLADEFFLAGTAAISDVKVYKVGFGYRYAVFTNLDVYGIAGFAKYDVPEGSISIGGIPFPGAFGNNAVVDDDGLFVTAGARYKITDEFEVGGGVDVFAGDNSDARPFVSGTYHINNKYSVSGEYFGGDHDNIYLSGRYHF